MEAKKPGEQTLDEIIAALSKEIPARFLQVKRKGGQDLVFFTWVTAQRFLDLYAPGWHGKATLTYSEGRVGCVYEISIPTSDGGLVPRAATGDDTEDDDDMPEFQTDDERKRWVQEQRQRNYGSPTTRAEGQAFKRAAGRFGFGLYLRDKGRV